MHIGKSVQAPRNMTIITNNRFTIIMAV